MTALLSDEVADVYKCQNSFTTDDEGNLFYTTPEGLSPYIPQAFRADVLERMHAEYRLQQEIFGSLQRLNT